MHVDFATYELIKKKVLEDAERTSKTLSKIQKETERLQQKIIDTK